MTSENQGRGVADSPELIDIPGLEEITSTSEQEPTQRETNDRQLAQAINYLVKEGGDDSPATFMNRVDRIDNSLLLPLSQQGRNFDIKLFNRVLAMVSQAQRDFDETVQGSSSEEDPSSVSSGEPSMLESAEAQPEYYTPSGAEALYRKADGADEPRSKTQKLLSTSEKPAAEKDQDVRLEQMYKYGGPENEVETWYKNYPASLPFPETFQLAHWESLKIDFDLSEPGKQMKAEGKIVETNIPFDHPALEQYKTLPPYESGSRFKLPKSSAIVEKEIDRLGTPGNLAKVVEDFNRSNDEVDAKGQYLYTPRVFLEKFTVDPEDLTTIRHAVNTTPTKSRTSTRDDISQRDPSHTLSSIKYKNLVPPTSRAQTASPIVRKINRKRATSLERSPRRQSGVSTVPPSPAPPTKKTTVHPKAVIEKRPSDRPSKPAASVPSRSQPVPEPISVATPKSTKEKPTKRKRSISEGDYTVDTKRSKSMITKTRTATGKVTKKAVVAGRVAGKAQTKMVVKELIEEEQYAVPVAEKQKKKKPEVRAGSTRSGLRYLKK